MIYGDLERLFEAPAIRAQGLDGVEQQRNGLGGEGADATRGNVDKDLHERLGARLQQTPVVSTALGNSARTYSRSQLFPRICLTLPVPAAQASAPDN